MIHSPEDVIAAGITRITEDARSREEMIQSLRNEIQLGLDDIENGCVISGDEVFSDMTQK